MSFQLSPACRAGDEVRRIAQEKIVDCRARLEAVKTEPEASVHALRKNFKRLRSLFRLLNQGGNLFVRGELERFRDLGRMFAGARDAAVLEQSLIKLQFITNDESLIGHLEKLTERVQQKLASAKPAARPRLPVARATKELQKADDQLIAAVPSDLTLLALVKGYVHTYRSVRKTMHKLPHSTTEEDWHDWRKLVKDDWYQTQILKKTRRGKASRRLKELRQLADLLGYDHDLSVLSELIVDSLPRLTELDLDVLDLIDRQRRGLQRRCLELGSKLYDRKPSHVFKQFSRALNETVEREEQAS